MNQPTTTATHLVTMTLGHTVAGPDTVGRREQRDRIRAAFLNGLRREPGTVAASDTPTFDLTAVVAILAWEGVVTAPVHDLVVYGTVDLVGRVSGGVVSNGVTAQPVTHIDQVADAVAAVTGTAA